MSHVPNELAEEFPDQADRIHALKLSNPQFSELIERFHALNRQIHRVETRLEPAADKTEEELKRRRLALLDAINEALASAPDRPR
jgi:uncharacterized protein YdcH (DUF465 family)